MPRTLALVAALAAVALAAPAFAETGGADHHHGHVVRHAHHRAPPPPRHHRSHHDVATGHAAGKRQH